MCYIRRCITHKKFKEKIDINNLLCEIEDIAHDIKGLYLTSCHLFDFCVNNDNIEQIKNMSFIVENMRNNLFCLNKEIQNIINRRENNKSNFPNNIAENVESGNYIITDD